VSSSSAAGYGSQSDLISEFKLTSACVVWYVLNQILELWFGNQPLVEKIWKISPYKV